MGSFHPHYNSFLPPRQLILCVLWVHRFAWNIYIYIHMLSAKDVETNVFAKMHPDKVLYSQPLMIVIVVDPYSMSPPKTGIPLVHCHFLFLGVTYSIGMCQELTVLLAHQRLSHEQVAHVEGWIGCRLLRGTKVTCLDWDAPLVGEGKVKRLTGSCTKEIQKVIILLWPLLLGGGSTKCYLTVSILIIRLKMFSWFMYVYLLIFIYLFIYLFIYVFICFSSCASYACCYSVWSVPFFSISLLYVFSHQSW